MATDKSHSGSEIFIDPVDGSEWEVDMAFMASNWTCIWGDGCEGILTEPAVDLGQGCCSVGAQILDEDEASRIATLAMTLDPARFQYHAVASVEGVFTDGGRTATRLVDGACVFLNRPEFDGGPGCALHLAAADDGDSPMDWKPAVCWQVPLRVENLEGGRRRVRRWSRSDWGDEDMAWCCTERQDKSARSLPTAFRGSRPVAETLGDELAGIVGPEVAVAIRRRAAEIDDD